MGVVPVALSALVRRPAHTAPPTIRMPEHAHDDDSEDVCRSFLFVQPNPGAPPARLSPLERRGHPDPGRLASRGFQVSGTG